jgi:hypothetical protein
MLAVGAGLTGPALLADTAVAATSPATAAIDGRAVVYTAAPGQTNNVTVTASKNGADITYVIDDAVTISAGDGCTP